MVGNASYRKSKKATEFLGGCKGEAMLVYLQPYTPELNPIERCSGGR